MSGQPPDAGDDPSDEDDAAENKGNVQRTIASSVAWTALGTWGDRGVSTLVFILLARLLEPEEFGVVALAGSIAILVGALQDAGIPKALVQAEHVGQRAVNTAFTFNLAASFVLAGLGILLAPLIAEATGDPSATPIIRWMMVVLIPSAFATVPLSMLQRELRFDSITLRTLAARGIAAPLALVLAFAGAGAYALVAQSLTFAVVAAIVVWRQASIRPRFGFDVREFRKLAGFGGLVLIATLLNTTTTNIDNILIGATAGLTQLGFYALAYRILEVLGLLFNNILGQVALPLLSRRRDEPELHRAATLEMVNAGTSVAAPAFVGIAVVSFDLLPLALGEVWVAAAPIVAFLSVVGLMRVAKGPADHALLSLGKARTHLNLTLIRTSTRIAVIVVTAQFGPVQVAAGLAAHSLLDIGVVLWMFRHRLSISPRAYLRAAVPPLIAAVLMGGVTLAVRTALAQATGTASVLDVALQILTGVVTYPLLLRVLDRPASDRIVKLTRRGLAAVRAWWSARRARAVDHGAAGEDED